MQSLRFPIAAALAVAVTFGLFWSMQALIGVAGELKEAKPQASIDFVRLRRDNAPQEKEREKPKKEKPEQPPPPPDISMSSANLQPGEMGMDIGAMVDASAEIGDAIGAGGGTDRDAVPLVRTEPEYPMRARQRGIEGWVLVRFNVNKAGGVTDPVAVKSHPGNIFNKAAVAAVRRWRYNPKIQGGKAVERRGLQTVVDFSMDR